MIKILIGPNGYDKTTKLVNLKKELISGGVNESEILFLESEILLLDEVKDTKNNTATMEYILTELLATDDYDTKQKEFEDEVDKIITDNQVSMNNLLDDIISMNESKRTKDFITVSTNKEYKKLVSIDSTDVKNTREVDKGCSLF